jgi:C-terminal processing protease CtpA/Prc
MKNRVLGTFLVLAALSAVSIAVVFRRTTDDGGTATRAVPSQAQQVISNSVELVKSQISGGIGIGLAIDPSRKLPKVAVIMSGSPAHSAGLNVGDFVTRVDGISTTGLSLTQVLSNFRGFTAMSVPVTVLRGTNHLDFVIRRASMKSLQQRTIISNPHE